MNCADVRQRLAALVYGDLPPEEVRPLQEHLAGCSECRREHAALEQLRQLLDTVPPPARTDGAVDLSRLYRAVAQRQALRQRRWRRVAVAACAVAAAVLGFAVLPHLEIRVEANQLTLRWGTIPAAPAPPLPAPVVRSAPEPTRSPTPATDLDRRLKVVEELVQIVASDVETRDRQQQALRQALGRIQARLQQMQTGARGDRGPDLRTISFNSPERKGDNP